MPRYFDADALLSKMPDDLPYKSSVKRVLMQATAADVAPKSEVAREIFEEIEEALFNNHCLDDGTDFPTPHYFEELKDDIAELKKKHTGDQT